MGDAFDPFEHNGPGELSRYVIVGCGFSAVLNHLTLRKSDEGRKRIGNRPVLHIGQSDPWLHYRPHLMGQLPHLLEIPGYRRTFASEDGEQPLRSDRFAAATAAEFDDLLSSGEATKDPLGPCLSGWVALIESKEPDRTKVDALTVLKQLHLDCSGIRPYPKNAPPFRLLVVLDINEEYPRCVPIYADRVDLCTGSGVPRLLPQDLFSGSVERWHTYGLRHRPWQPIERFNETRAVTPAQHALYANNPPNPRADRRICLYGTGGIALNLVETCPEGAQLDWMAPTVHLRWNCERNNGVFGPDTHAPSERPRCLRPHRASLRFGEWIDIRSISDESIELGFHTWNPRFDPPVGVLCNSGIPQIRNHLDHVVQLTPPTETHAEGAALAKEAYDELIVSLGLETERVPGTLGFITQSLGLWKVADPNNPDQRLTSLSTAGGRIRALGSAALSIHPRAFASDDEVQAKKASAEYQNTLPIQTRPQPEYEEPAKVDPIRVLQGITLNAVSVALANGYFGPDRVNRNVNTATDAELELVLGDERLARVIVGFRKDHQFGFRTPQELIAKLSSAEGLPIGWRERLDRLRYNYSDTDQWV